ncbi:MAG: hypothetical protein CVU97_04890 [Firmicutes bacterium HGW-Firmicutes-21]|nr:MAG: hypothetical protein CVU97_04890 [Firmicutes bacterium HGW-Firmicutes-21]
MSSAENRVRFNILDVLIVLIIIALIIGVFFRNNIVELLSPDKSVEITYTFELKEVDSTRLSYLTQNTPLASRDSGGSMGRIVSVTPSVSVITEYAVDGSIMHLERSGYYDVTVRAVARGYKSDSGVFLDGEVLIAPGMKQYIITATAVYEAIILSIN